MSVIFEKTPYLTEKPFHYCPGCNHGIIHRLVAECLEESGMGEKIAGVAPVGCSVFAYDYFNCDMLEAAHGRAPAVATGVKRAKPDTLVFTYQGDGDLASIGTAEIVHAAHRGEKIVTIFVNNAIYGMTGGQMAPTTLVGQRTTTSPYGRDEAWCGAPIKMSEMLAQVPGAYYIERCAVDTNANIIKTKKAIKKVPGNDPYRVMASANKRSCHRLMVQPCSPLTNRLQTLPPQDCLFCSGCLLPVL